MLHERMIIQPSHIPSVKYLRKALNLPQKDIFPISEYEYAYYSEMNIDAFRKLLDTEYFYWILDVTPVRHQFHSVLLSENDSCEPYIDMVFDMNGGIYNAEHVIFDYEVNTFSNWAALASSQKYMEYDSTIHQMRVCMYSGINTNIESLLLSSISAFYHSLVSEYLSNRNIDDYIAIIGAENINIKIMFPQYVSCKDYEGENRLFKIYEILDLSDIYEGRDEVSIYSANYEYRRDEGTLYVYVSNFELDFAGDTISNFADTQQYRFIKQISE